MLGHYTSPRLQICVIIYKLFEYYHTLAIKYIYKYIINLASKSRLVSQMTLHKFRKQHYPLTQRSSILKSADGCSVPILLSSTVENTTRTGHKLIDYFFLFTIGQAWKVFPVRKECDLVHPCLDFHWCFCPSTVRREHIVYSLQRFQRDAGMLPCLSV